VLLARAGRYADARAAYRRLLGRAPERPLDWADAARAALAAGDPAAAEELLARGCARHPAALELWKLRGLAAKRGGRHADALAHFLRAADLDPGDPSLLNEIGIARVGVGDLAAARRAFEAALAADPGYAPARANLARLAALSSGGGLVQPPSPPE
jgi:tetratricopeptide (TPR) repeat protein